MIAIIDYNAGNLASVARAVAHLGFACTVTHDPEMIRRAERIIFPGVGAAGAAMDSLRRLGIDAVLRERSACGTPLLGICLGSQVILEHSDENDTPCLGLLAGRARAFPAAMRSPDGTPLKIPHMGWNRIGRRRDHPLFEGIGPEDEFYFVHSFYPVPEHPEEVLGVTGHGVEFASVIGRGRLVATQFHLEKSGRPGLRMLRNFCAGFGGERPC
ncbi:MAG: imidazole glycerol phosphate synthase subunit HisH [Desulfobacterales bacterium]|jgi:glutamine amidotransferase|nr:imidazole glycerol phosphate synthase subunit HisH [Desulfobacterales bacterium]MCU0585066.1 imidazole glycerol phosphate synthase subunit HisH [Desulfobacterales bacterium]